MSNFLAKGVYKKLEEQSVLLKNNADFPVSDEVAELDKKFGECIINYNSNPLYVTKVTKGPIFVGSLFINGLWVPQRVELTDPGLNLQYISGGLINTPSGLYTLLRTTRKQYKWGLTENNCSLNKVDFSKGKPSVGEASSLRNGAILTYLFTNNYPNFYEIQRNRKMYKLKNGLALSPIVSLTFIGGIHKLFYKDLLVAESPKIKDGFELPEKYIFLKELLSNYCEVV